MTAVTEDSHRSIGRGNPDRAISGPQRPLVLPDVMEPLAPPPWLLQRCDALGIQFEGDDVSQLGTFLALLLEANRIMNLTTVTQPDAAWEKHIFDSLTLLPVLASVEARRVVDVGSGGGVPGLPLAIVMPEVSFTLVEATGKKARFLELAVQRLGLHNVTVTSERAEIIGRDRERHREQYDTAIVRAVGHLAIVLELCAPLVRVGGYVMAVKGEKAKQEIDESRDALRMLHADVTQTIDTPTGCIVIAQKLQSTPRLYPRRPGEPKRMPLGLPQR